MSTLKIKVAFNGFIVEADDKAQIFGTTDSLLEWLKENLPKFTGASAEFDLAAKKGRTDG